MWILKNKLCSISSEFSKCCSYNLWASFNKKEGKSLKCALNVSLKINPIGERHSNGCLLLSVCIFVAINNPLCADLFHRVNSLAKEQFSCLYIFTRPSRVALFWKIPTCHASKPFSTWISKTLKSLCEVRSRKLLLYTT